MPITTTTATTAAGATRSTTTTNGCHHDVFLWGEARKFAYKLTFKLLNTIFTDHPRVFRSDE
jgi:hypothetical protein